MRNESRGHRRSAIGFWNAAMQRARSAMVFAAMSGLTACTTPAVRPPDTRLDQLWQAHAAMLRPVQHWDLRGRLAVQIDEQGGQASLSWQRDANRQMIRLNGPFGQGAVRITQDETGARLQDSRGQTLEDIDAGQLVARYTGWQLPIAYLEWWLLGLPVPALQAEHEYDEAGRLRSLRQQAWDVRYEDYRLTGNLFLPHRLTLIHRGGASPGLEARFVIDRWALVK